MTETLREIARRINEHLQKFEADPAINTETRPSEQGGRGPTRFYHACAWPTGARVEIRYISYQGTVRLKKVDAIAYLTWLDSGGKGKHYDFLRYRNHALREQG